MNKSDDNRRFVKCSHCSAQFRVDNRTGDEITDILNKHNLIYHEEIMMKIIDDQRKEDEKLF